MRQNRWVWFVCTSLVILGLAIWSDQQTISRGWERLDRFEYPQPRVCTAGDGGDACIYGMFVGVETYQRHWLDTLHGSDEGMTELYNAFVNRHLMRPEDGIVLTNENVNSRAIRNTFVALSRRMRPKDIFVFSFTGHGNTHRLATYNVGIDVTAKQLRRLLQMIPAETLFINLDSCMSGSFAQSVGHLSGRKKIVGVFSSRATELSFSTFVYRPTGPSEYLLRPRVGYYLFLAVHELGINGIVTASTLTAFLQARYAEGDAERTYGQHLVTTGPPDVVLWRAHPWNRTRH